MGSYLDRYRPPLAAVALGIIFAALDEVATGVIAALPWPRWYVDFARMHRHLSLELWPIVVSILPISLLAAGFGMLLGRLARSSSLALPWLALGVWFVWSFGTEILALAGTCRYPLQTLWNDFLLFPISNLLGIALPSGALIIGYRQTWRPRSPRLNS